MTEQATPQSEPVPVATEISAAPEGAARGALPSAAPSYGGPGFSGRPTPRDPRQVLAMQRMVGNAAVSQWVGEAQPARVVAREPQAVDKAKLESIEKLLSGIAKDAKVRGDRILVAQDGCIESLKLAKGEIKKRADNYKKGYAVFKGKLKEADARAEIDKAIEDSVQGILVAAALAAFGPEIALAAAGRAAALRLAASANGVVQRVGYGAAAAVLPTAAKAAEGAAGEVAEQVAGQGVDAVQSTKGGDDQRPSDTAEGGGASSGDKFEEAFGKLGALVDALPAYGTLGNSQKNLALAAQEMITDAVRLRHGEQGRSSEAELEEKSTALLQESDKGVGIDDEAVEMQLRMQQIAHEISSSKSDEPGEVERKLWMRWMASLSDSEILDNQVIEDYLGPEGKGLIPDWGVWHSDDDQRLAVEKAQRDWAIETTGAAPVAPVPGVSPPTGPPPSGPPPGPPPSR